jgi:hypothetical protein
MNSTRRIVTPRWMSHPSPVVEPVVAAAPTSRPTPYIRDTLTFADPGGNSALRAASKRNPRNLPCPTCGAANVLTPLDRQKGYQCDRCAEGGGYGYGDY